MKRIGVFLIVLLVSTIFLVSGCQSTPQTPSVEPPVAPTEEPTVIPAPTPSGPQPVIPGEEEPTPAQDAQEEEILYATAFGLTFWSLNPEGTKYIAYGLGNFGLPRRNFPSPDPFPLIISRSVEGGPQEIIATISNPNLQEIGDEWESPIITDPDYNTTFKVKVIKIEEIHRDGADRDKMWNYRTIFFVSPDWSDKWFPPITVPPVRTIP
ncbi:hypothetical protein KAT51_07935 [bacterium]|nr:hypothetical protein [bacterium]